MIFETYKLSLNDLKVTCSTTIYKNLSLIMRICSFINYAENRQYSIIPSTGYFDGASAVKLRAVDTIDFQFDLERNKYLPKQIELELKLFYRTGKINQKLYPLNLNQFTTLRKGVKEKTFKVIERLYSLECTILAKSNGTDSPLVNQNLRGLQRVKSEKRFEEQPQNYLNKKRYYNSKSPQHVIKYTINERIHITKTDENSLNNQIQTQNRKQVREVSILKEDFEVDEASSSFAERNKQFTQRVKKSIEAKKPIAVNQYPIKSINDRHKLQTLQSQVRHLSDELKKEKENSYRLQKQIAALKNKIEHLHHQKDIILKEKEEEKEAFLTRDKQSKIRQRRDLEQQKRHFEELTYQKDKQIKKLTDQLKQTYSNSINSMNRANECQQKADELSTFFHTKIQELQSQIFDKNREINFQSKQIASLVQQKSSIQPKLSEFNLQASVPQSKIYITSQSRQHIHTNNLEHVTNFEEVINYEKSFSQNQISQQNEGHDKIHQSLSKLELNPQNEQLLFLVDQQTRTYHQMISRLEQNIQKLQTQLKNMEILHINTTQQLQQKNFEIQKWIEIVNQKNETIKTLQSQVHIQKIKSQQINNLLTKYSINGVSFNDCHVYDDHQSARCRSKSLGCINPGVQTIRFKTTEKYKVTIESQNRVLYIPDVYQNSHRIK